MMVLLHLLVVDALQRPLDKLDAVMGERARRSKREPACWRRCLQLSVGRVWVAEAGANRSRAP